VHAAHSLADLVDKVLLVQIRASEDTRQEPAGGRGWFYATLGPLVTLVNVSTTSQRNHNDAQLIGLKALLSQQEIPLETVEFELDIKAPLSWHLTEHEKNRITAQWSRSPGIAAKRERLACLWRNPAARWSDECHTRSTHRLAKPEGPGTAFQASRVSGRASKPVSLDSPPADDDERDDDGTVNAASAGALQASAPALTRNPHVRGDQCVAAECPGSESLWSWAAISASAGASPVARSRTAIAWS
jgi:hypothetical protein